jgi:hypothetical protein
MARYYFNLVNEQRTIPDREGVEVADTDLKELIATILEEIRAEEAELCDLGGEWSIEVVDGHGHRVAKFPL